MTVVVGLDLSLTATGIATPAGVRTITSSGRAGASLRVRRARLIDIATRVSLAVAEQTAASGLGGALVVIEAPAFSRTTGHQHDRSGCWWLVVEELLSAGHLVVEVAPTARAKYGAGKGNAGKAAVVSAVSHRYGITFDDDNAADAFVLRAMGCDHLGQPLAVVPQTHRAALDKVAWPLPSGASA